MSCSDVLCFLFLHVWRSSAARVPNVLYFRLFFVSCLFLFSVFAAVAVFEKRFLLKIVFSPGFSDEFDGFDGVDDVVDAPILEVSRDSTILARFFWKLIRPPSELLLF